MYEIALVSAIDEELEGLDLECENVLISSLGVGNLVASIRLTEILLQNPGIREVIFIGSAGTYNSSSCPYPSLAFGLSYNYIEPGVWQGISKVPKLMPVFSCPERGKFGEKILNKLKLPAYCVNSPNSITLSFWYKEVNIANSVNKNSLTIPENIFLENMECFGLSLVCEKKNLGFTSLLAVTNEVGPDGSSEWLKNYKALGRKLCERIREAWKEIENEK